jgi:hypothetical protein
MAVARDAKPDRFPRLYDIPNNNIIVEFTVLCITPRGRILFYYLIYSSLDTLHPRQRITINYYTHKVAYGVPHCMYSDIYIYI